MRMTKERDIRLRFLCLIHKAHVADQAVSMRHIDALAAQLDEQLPRKRTGIVVIIIAFIPDVAFAFPKLLKPEWF